MDKGKSGSRFRQGGAVAVEFALVLPLLLLAVGGAVELGRAFWFYDALSKATRDSARYLSRVNCYSSETPSACNARLELEDVIGFAKTMVTTAAAQADVTGLDATQVEVRCDASICPNSSAVLGSAHVTVAIVGYGIRLGEWLPLSYSGDAASYNLGIQPRTTMRYMGG